MKLLSHYLESQQKIYSSIENWKNHIINDMLVYSYRHTLYTRRTYPSNLHYHDYYELVIFEEGNIKYICNSHVYDIKEGNGILIPPGNFHMSVINDENTTYKRHVFYLYPEAFDELGCESLASFLKETTDDIVFSLPSHAETNALLGLLTSLNEAFENENSSLERALVLGYILQIFYCLNKKMLKSEDVSAPLPENIRILKQYIDENFTNISSVSEVAEHFFYSREHISRLFKKHFDTTISDYILQRRIAQSQALIIRGVPIIDAAYKVGFGSLSTFIRAFRSITNMTPSQYRKLRKDNS